MVLAGLASIAGWVLILPLVVLAIPFWTIRGLTRMGAGIARRRQPAETSWGGLIQYEDEVGWRPKPSLDVHARAGGLFHLTTDAEGWRGRLSIDEADLVVMGDSFAFGHGADDAVLFTEFVPGARAKSVGANGYNLVQSYLWMERLAPRLKGKTVAWFVYYDNDLLENLLPFQQHYRMPFVREVGGNDDWEIVTEHVSPEPWPFRESRSYTVRLAEICSSTRLSRRAFSAAEFLIGRGRQTCAGAGAELAVVGIPSPELVRPEEHDELASLAPTPNDVDVRLPDRRLAEICEQLHVPFLPLSEHLGSSDYLVDDCHWTPRGHRRVGELLGALHQKMRGGADPATRAVARPFGSPASSRAGS